MKVTKITSPEQLRHPVSEKMTDEQLRNEYCYIRAEQITRKLLENGLITADECDKIMVANRKTFLPHIADLFCATALKNGENRVNM